MGTLLAPVILAQLAAAGAVALALYLGLRLVRSSFLVPGILLLAAALAHLAFVLTGTTLSEALALGWTFKAPTAVGLAPTWDFGDVRVFPWHLLPGLSADIFAVMFVTAITMLLNTTGIELLTRREADLQRELTTLGVTNFVIAALGGYISCISLSRTTLTYTAGGRSRVCGLTVAAASVLMLAVDPGFIAYIPKFVLGGLLLYLGASLMYVAGRRGPSDLAARICLAARHSITHRSVRLYCRRIDRRRHRLRYLCRQREPGQCHQVQLRRLGISFHARSRT
jgi:sulfate permease, SulP family